MIERVEDPRSRAGRCRVREERREGEKQRGVGGDAVLIPRQSVRGLMHAHYFL